MQQIEIEQKQARRWADWQRPISTPCMDRVLALGPQHVPDKPTWKWLLRLAALIDTHLQRSGARHDLPNTHRAYLDSFERLIAKYGG